MQPDVTKICSNSYYYIYTPSHIAEKLYLYPISIGHYYYEANYQIKRNHFDSFLIMYVVKGSCTITTKNFTHTLQSGESVLINCYEPHSYGSDVSWESYWIHFDGILAKSYFEEIINRHKPILSHASSHFVTLHLEKIYHAFHTGSSLSESMLSKIITELLDYFLVHSLETQVTTAYTSLIADSIRYINQHFEEPISLALLAKQTNLSLYYFVKVFSKETGMTPYQYLMNTRISAAKFLLRFSDTPIKDIAFRTGFHSESSFCSCFKKQESLTPSQYRMQ